MEEVGADASQRRLAARKRRRERADLLRSRLVLLAGKDKALMTMYLENGNSFRQIGRLLGVSDTSIARRVRTLSKRLIDGEYVVCLRNRGDFTKRQLDVAKDYFLTGLSVEKIAAEKHWSPYRVRQTVKKIQRLVNKQPITKGN